MERKDYYLFKEILFGLRQEYIANNARLDDMAQVIYPIDRDISKVSVNLDKNYGSEDRKVAINILYRQHIIARALSRISHAFSARYPSEETFLVGKNIDGVYDFSKLENKVFCMEDYDFAYKADKVAESQSQIKDRVHTVLNDDIDASLVIAPDRIGLYAIKTKTNPGFSFTYLADTDSIDYIAWDMHPTKLLHRIMNLKVSRDILPIAHKCIIDRSSCLGKELDISGIMIPRILRHGHNNLGISNSEDKVFIYKK